MANATRLENFSYAWPGAEDWTLRKLTLELPQGECHWLSGASGSGKTTLALALKGLLPPGRQQGELILPQSPEARSAAVGLVLQNPETQLLTETVGAEVAFGLENLCLPPAEMPARVRAALDAVGLDLPFAHATKRLSMGQKYRLLLAAQLVLQPALLILDEPAGQLDDGGLKSLAKIIASLKKQGLIVLLCEHRPGPLREIIDRQWQLDPRGCLIQALTELPAVDPPRCPPISSQNQLPAVEVLGLTVANSDATPAWHEADLVLQRGEKALLWAPNGTGKTTLLRCLAGLLPPSGGSIRISGRSPASDLRGHGIGYLFQNPRRQLFETTVYNEVAFGLRRQGIRGEPLKLRVNSSLELCHIGHLTDRSPHRLSYGQQHLVALASVLARQPELLLLDDPLSGLDPETATLVLGTLFHFCAEHGSTLLWTSHRQPDPDRWDYVTFSISGGRLVQC